jgi:hypothetical protein
MKKLSLQLFTFTCLCLAINVCVSSCKKASTTDTTSTTTVSGSFTFKVDGSAAITVDSAKGYLYSVKNIGRQMDVYAYKGGVEIMEFHFDPKTGTKTAGTTLGAGAFLTYMESPTKSWDSQSGTLNLTTCDTVGKKVEGDFSFVSKQYPYTGTAIKTITEGHMVFTKITK